MEIVHPADRSQDIDLAPEVERHLADLRAIREQVNETIGDLQEACRARIRSAFE